MNTVEKLNLNKEIIISTIKMKGPSLPVQIAREIGFSPLFTSAFLSELKAEGKINISNMRVGSSPLYFLPGQENQLERFVPYLNQREKEAFQLLKKEGILEDSKQSPVVRVALRAIKDFAISLKVRAEGESKLFWRYFTLTDEDVTRFVEEGFVKAKEDVKERKTEEKEDIEEKPEIKAIEETAEEKEALEERRPLAEKKKAKVQESEFAINVKDNLGARDIEIMHVVLEKKKEFEAKIRIDTVFGKQVYYLIAKDKKNVSDNDLSLALQKARGEKLPAIFMAPGEPNKKARQHLEEWGNLVKFEKLSF